MSGCSSYLSITRNPLTALSYQEVNATGNVTTNVAGYNVVTGMTITPTITGLYEVIFTGAVYNTNNNTLGNFALFVNGVQQTNYTRPLTIDIQILGLITLTSANIGVPGGIHGRLSLVAGQAVDVRFNKTGGPGVIGCGARSFSIKRVG